MQRLTEVGASNFSEIAASLAKAADFYDPDGGGFGEVLQTLIEAFDEELLLGSEGPVHHDRKQTALVQHVSAQVAGVSEHMAVMQALLGSERLRQVVARTKRRAEGRSYSEARAMWVLAEEEVAASGDTESAFQVHSEIGTLECGITHCSCLPARIICSRAARRGRSVNPGSFLPPISQARE